MQEMAHSLATQGISLSFLHTIQLADLHAIPGEAFQMITVVQLMAGVTVFRFNDMKLTIHLTHLLYVWMLWEVTHGKFQFLREISIVFSSDYI